MVYVTAGHYMEVKRLHSCYDYISAKALLVIGEIVNVLVDLCCTHIICGGILKQSE